MWLDLDTRAEADTLFATGKPVGAIVLESADELIQTIGLIVNPDEPAGLGTIEMTWGQCTSGESGPARYHARVRLPVVWP